MTEQYITTQQCIITEQFEFAGGSVLGRCHRLLGRNNQDAYQCRHSSDCTVAVVCDGCSSGRHSEVGAQIGARLIVQALIDVGAGGAEATRDAEVALEEVRKRVLAKLRHVATGMGAPLAAVVNDYLLFTVVGVWLTPQQAAFFSLGDGVLCINDQWITIGPFPGNAPPYLAYDLVAGGLHQSDPAALRFQVHATWPLHELDTFLIGTDGMHDLMRAANREIPGKTEVAGSVQQFWQQDGYFANADKVRRRLAALNRETVQVNRNGGLHKEMGLLPDDTTLIVGRRKMADTVRDKKAGEAP